MDKTEKLLISIDKSLKALLKIKKDQIREKKEWRKRDDPKSNI
jgi:hypothetical protein